ncbi:ABC transporter ATP-binding protein [Myceligenerans indicum]|uniref:ABC transporter ATP-binding protein n=1 Tax=Myceligenerans indicum TaxID=2593663 RepID=A0ABS1LJ52_9MICO|nr:ABC transporter ATP-binding protein [Myceligenerans indicum]MBL0885858.1 ABC transporter ATP-binding protein [Myceligenerans indicum]
MTEADAHLDLDLDLEFDREDLDGERPVPSLGSPVLVVDDLHVVFRVLGAKSKSATDAGAHVQEASPRRQSLLKRLVTSGSRHVGAVSEVHAVRGVSMVVRHGESVGIVGVNGSGKSTMLRAIAGLIPPTEGSVHAAGEPALLGVNAALMPQLSGERNIMIGGLALGLTQKQVEERYDEVVDFADIGEFVNLPMKTYSSGMGARLRFAISSAARPDILMVDEALATGDAAFRERSRARIEEIRKDAGTVFLVSHSIGTVEAMCTRVIWLHQGKIVMDGSTDEVVPEYQKFVRAHKRTKSGGRAGGVGPRARKKRNGGKGDKPVG